MKKGLFASPFLEILYFFVTVQPFIVKRENLKKFFTVIIHQKSRHFCNLADYLLLVEYFEIKNL